MHAASVKKPAKALSRSAADKLFSLALLTPAAIMTTLFILVPVIDSVVKSFQKFQMKNIIKGTPGVWNDFANYIKLFQNGRLTEAAAHTFAFVAAVVIAQFLLGMALALLLNGNVRGARFFRSIMMTPWVIPTVISALIWMWIYQPQYGLLKYLLYAMTGGQVADFAMLNNPRTALWGIAVAALWKQVPLMALLMLAGLQNVPEDMLEAATIDGAGAARRFLSITLPYLKSVIKVAVTMSIIENFKQFPLFQTMTGGGPDGATTTFAILSYREAFISNNLGSGAAVTTVWMLLMMVVVVLSNRLLRVSDMN